MVFFNQFIFHSLIMQIVKLKTCKVKFEFKNSVALRLACLNLGLSLPMRVDIIYTVRHVV